MPTAALIALAIAFAPGEDPDAGSIRAITAPAGIYLVYRTEIKALDEVRPISLSAIPRLRRFVRAAGLEQSPVFEYHIHFEPSEKDMYDLAAARFTARLLEIAVRLPSKPEDAGKYEVKDAGPFKCLSLVFKSPSGDSSEYWTRLYVYAKEHKLVPSGENREFQRRASTDDEGSASTELQLGIK